MALTRMNPLQDFTPLWDVMDRIITDSFGSPLGWPRWASNGTGSIPLEVYETPDQFVVRAFVPGVRPEDLDVQYDAGTLTIRGKTEAPELKDGWRTYLAEIAHGEFVRQVTLPRSIDVDQVRSVYEHGVLTLSLPKVAEARPHRIEIRQPEQLGSGTNGA